MTNRRPSSRPSIYEIRLQGVLDTQWADWFDGLTIKPQPGGETLLVGAVNHQAALHGLLAKIRDLGLPLLSLKRVAGEMDASTLPRSGAPSHVHRGGFRHRKVIRRHTGGGRRIA